MMRFIFALMVVVGTTTAIQSPNLGQTGFVTTMVEFAPGDTTCTTPVAITYQPTGVCIAALRQTSNSNNYPSVTPQGAIGTPVYTSTYQSYLYSVSSTGGVFISYYTDSSCVNPVTISSGGAQAADTPVVAQTCTQVLGGTTLNVPTNAGGGFEYTTMPFTFSATTPPTLGNVPTSIFNTYANGNGLATLPTSSSSAASTYASCSGLPTQTTIQNVALTQMAPFSSGNTCAKTACQAVIINGQPNGAAAPSLSALNNINVQVTGQNLCTVPTVSANAGYYLRNYYTDANCGSLDRVDQFQTAVCHPYGAGNIAPSGVALTYTGSQALSNTAGTSPPAYSAGANVAMYPEGLLPTQGTTMITFSYNSPGTWSQPTAGGNWIYTASSATSTNVYTTNYATSTCGSSSVLVFTPTTYNVVGSTAPSCSTSTTYIGSQSALAPYSLTYNVYGSGAYAPVAGYTQSTNSFTIAFSASVATTNAGVSTSTVTLTANPTTQVQKFYSTQNDCMSGNMVNLGWAQYTNIANGATSVTTPACVATSALTGGNQARNLASLSMCSTPTISTATSTNVNYLMVQQFDTSSCAATSSLGYYYIQLNVCHFIAGSTTTTVQYTLQAQTASSSTTNYNILQNYYSSTLGANSPVCNTANLLGSSIFGATGVSTAANAATNTPITAVVGNCMPSGTSFAQFSITNQPAAVSSVMSSYSTASYASTAACTSAYASTSPSTIGTGNLVQLYVPSSTCNQVMWQQSYQSTSASSVAATQPATGTPGWLYANNILTLDSATYGMSTASNTPFGQVTNLGTPSALPYYSQVSMVGCTNNAATATTSQCFTITQVYTGITVAQAQSTQFLTYLQGSVQSLLQAGNPTTTAATYTSVNLLSAAAVTGTTNNQVTVTFNVQLPSALYGTTYSTTTPWTGNPFNAATASSTMQSFFAGLATASNLVGGGNPYSSVQISSTSVTGSGCVATTIQLPGTVATATTTTIGTNTASNACFAASEVVTMENGSSKSIAEVQIGDRILSADAQGKTSFSDVVYVPHSANTIEATFVLLTTETGRSVKMTTNHIVPAGQCEGAMSVRRADAVSVGDCVMTVDGVEKVMDMVTMQGKGIYTVVTNKEYIVVNGIVATPFGGVNPTLANMYYNLHRMMYAFMPQALVSSQGAMQQVMDKFASLIL